MTENEAVYEFEGFRLDAKKQRLYRNDAIIALPPKAVELLTLMAESPGRVLEKENLIETLWQDTFVEESNLTQTVYLLRKALGKNENGEPRIATLPKLGYKFIPVVHKISPEIDNPADKQIIEPQTPKNSHEDSKNITNGNLKDSDFQTVTTSHAIPASGIAEFFSQKKYLFAGLLIVLLLGTGAFFAWQSEHPAEFSSRRKTLIVVPFNVIGDDHKNYLGLGLADTLITRLGKTRKINVRSTEEIQRFSEAEKDPLALGRKLNADVVLTGTIQQIDDRARLNAQLLDINDGQIIWSKQFDENSADLFTLQDKVTTDLSDALTLSLTDSEQKDINQKPTENIDALKLYWQGRFYWNRRTPEWVQQGIKCFEEAIQLDPNFAKAYAGLADSYALTVSGLPPNERFPKAIAAAQRALQLNENLAEAHTSLAFVTSKFSWDWESAETHYKRAIQLDNSYPTAHHWYGEFLILRGKYDEGLKELARAEELDPFSTAIKTDIAEGLYRARRYQEALAQTDKVLQLDPRNVQIYRIIRRIQKQTSSDEQEIVKTDLQTQRLSNLPPEDLARLEKLFAEQNWKVYWETRLAQVSKAKVIPYIIEKAEIYLHVGDKQAAVEQLTRQINNHELTPLVLREEPLFDSLRSDQKFQVLLQLGGFNSKS